MSPDIVYLVRRGDANDELRYSLRSLTNLPHGQVWLAGHQPRWTRNVGRIPVRQSRGKWPNQEANIRAACLHPDVSDPFVMFNDDFFVIEPLDRVPVWHRGPIGERLDKYASRTDEYPARMRATADYLGVDALAYDAIHIPMTFHKQPLLDVLDTIPDGVLFRSVYGNRQQIGGTKHRDVKVARSRTVPAGPLVSTSDGSFRRLPVGRHIRNLFPDPGPYER